MPFVYRHRVRFADCDPAGIAYFPRIFDWFHAAMEAWFDEALGHPYAAVITSGVGFPAVHSEADFTALCVLGDDLDVQLALERLGTRSLTLAYRITGRDDADDLRVTGRTVVVVTDLAARRSCDPPASLRVRLEREAVTS